MTGVAGTPLEGVTYKITKLNFDLQNDDWTSFPKTAAEVTDTMKSATTFEVTTGVDGKAFFDNLELGLYLVEETAAPDGIVAGAPFLVSIPMVNEASDSWNYNVVAYPKNSETKVEKQVTDADKNIQDAYTYTINADAPTFGADQQLTAFRFEDTLDPRLVFQEVTEVKAGDVVLDAATDYTVEAADPATNGNKLTVTLTEAGLAKVTSGAKMSMSFNVKRTEVGDTTDVKNTADVIFNNPNTGDEVKNTTNEVVTYHGKLKVVKKDGQEAGTVLEGAEFQLYQCTSAVDLGTQIAIDGVDTWTTDANGEIMIDGLHATDFEDNAENAATTKKFCLVETKAPAGYVLPENATTEVNFTRADIANTADGTDAITMLAEVENIKQDTPNLPMTGGAGVGILAAIGAAIVAAGAWFARRGAKN